MDMEIIGEILFCCSELELKKKFEQALLEIGIISFSYSEIQHKQNTSIKLIPDISQKRYECYVSYDLNILEIPLNIFNDSKEIANLTMFLEENESSTRTVLSINIVESYKFIKFDYIINETEKISLWLQKYTYKIKMLSTLYHQKAVQFSESSNIIFNVSGRELECAQWVSSGLTAKIVAKKMNISERTVRFHLCSLRDKLNVKSKEEVIALLAYHRLITI
ncbi:helix-turn-helix transcriptional regulator [Thalassotalea sp. PLHSN55]|uniref:helix-turn-helix transcriptional regulator n=1 Tax=Thalassotalea sp. PLHSN55 TaxID=3435888 RepID=UPI003F834C51